MATLPVDSGSADALLDPDGLTPSPRRQRRPAAPARRALSPPTQADELASRRRRKADETEQVLRYVDDRISALERQETYAVPRLYVAVAGSLAPGHLLSLVIDWTERSDATPDYRWIRRSVQEWIDFSGLHEDDWVAARQVLRDKGLIQERRSYDLAVDEIVVEIAFAPEVFAAEVARVRELLIDDSRQRLRNGQLL